MELTNNSKGKKKTNSFLEFNKKKVTNEVILKKKEKEKESNKWNGGSLALKIDFKKMILHAHAQKNSQILKKKKNLNNLIC